jgi:glycine hydroxymethyltransferase
MDLSHGGHLTHGSPVSFSGKQCKFSAYQVDPETHLIDYDQVASLAREHKPKMIVAGASAYPRFIDWARFREIADEVGALFMADMAHIAGLVAAGVHPSPVPYADIVTTTTHKSLRGPRGGLILSKAKYARAIDRTVFPMLQGGPILGAVAARAVCFHEAMQPSFRTYSEQVVKNAAALADEMWKQGLSLVSGGTENHLLVLSLLDRSYTGAKLAEALERAGIITSKSTVPGETRSPRQTSGVRFGTPAVTTRGATEDQMRQVARAVARVVADPDDAARIDEIRTEMRSIADSLVQI